MKFVDRGVEAGFLTLSGKNRRTHPVLCTAMLIILFLVVIILAYANGSNDNFKAMATLYGSSTLNYRNSLLLASIAQILGSATSVILAGALLKAFSGKGLVPEAIAGDPTFLLAVGAGAAMTVLMATRLGMPISTTHALIGGLVGSALALAPGELIWSSLGAKFLLPLLLTPFLATFGAAALYPIARMCRKKLNIDEVTCLCVGKSIEPVAITSEGALIAARTGLELSVEQAEQCERRYLGSLVGIPAHRIVDVAHIFSGLSLGFARGLNDTPKIMALLMAVTWAGLNSRLSLVIIATAMCLGGLIHSARIASTMGRRITAMNRGQGFIANFIASGLAIGASLIGSPVSVTHVSTGAIFGIGVWTGRSDWKVAGEIILAWLVTLPVAATIAFVIAFGAGLI